MVATTCLLRKKVNIEAISEDIDLICSLILLERRLVKFPVTSDYSRIKLKDLVENFSRREISNLLHIVPYLFHENYDNNQ